MFVGGYVVERILRHEKEASMSEYGFTKEQSEGYFKYPRIVGYIDRVLYTTSWIYRKYAFIGVWLAFKVASRWEAAKMEPKSEQDLGEEQNTEKDKKLKRKRFKSYADYNAFLIGNGISLIFAVVGGAMVGWLKSDPIDLIKVILLPLIVVLVLRGINLPQYLELFKDGEKK
jgi:F0F1-type ATP synthase assembly protein I